MTDFIAHPAFRRQPPAMAFLVIIGFPALLLAQAGGIEIDAEGVVREIRIDQRTARLDRQRIQAWADERLDGDLNRQSDLRKIALARLEQAIGRHVDRGQVIPDDIRNLAGLQRIDYILLYPEHQDIVIAGPAEGFGPDSAGRMIGTISGRPTVRLDDLIVALRSSGEANLIHCSIDPVPERLLEVRDFVRNNNNPVPVKTAMARYDRMTELLGMQTVSLSGIPPRSHFGRTLVEADFRMKRIAIGIDEPQLRNFTSHLAMVRPGGNTMHRWWFLPLYDQLVRNADGTAWHWTGPRAQLMSQEERIDAEGRRFAAATTQVSAEKFAMQFTRRFGELADRVPVFADLQNLIDLAVLAALFERERLPDRAGWTMDLFLDQQRLPSEAGPVPSTVKSICNYRLYRRRLVIGAIGGGIVIRPDSVIQAMESADSPELDKLRNTLATDTRFDQDSWWWD